MDGRHAEDPAPGELEGGDLQHHGDGLEHEHAGHDEKDDLLAHGDGDRAERGAEGQRADVALSLMHGGAAMFLTTVVLGAVVIFSTRNDGACEVERGTFLRDVLAFSVAVALLFFFGHIWVILS
mgnify:CR=1 FL=1